MATAQASRLENMPKPLVTVTHLIHEGKLLRAEDQCRAYLTKFPKDVEGMRLLADIVCGSIFLTMQTFYWKAL